MSRRFSYENAKRDIPVFWQEYFAAGNGKYACGMFGINIDPEMGNESRMIPAFTWAVFPCRGPLSSTMQDVNTKLFSEWLPGQKEYAHGAGYCVEMYDEPSEYPKGTEDENYYAEIWIPVRKKYRYFRAKQALPG